jgi:hypothetical protein
VIGAARDRGCSGPHATGCRIAEHRREIWELASQRGAGNRALVAQPRMQSLNRVRDGTCVEPPDLLEVGSGKTRWLHALYIV